jgi:hypothetical protein
MGYSIVIVKDKFSNNEKEIYKNTLDNETNINLIIDLIKRFDDLEQQINYNEEV